METLEKVAEAMNCRLVYAVIPVQGTLEDIITANARKAAERIVDKTRHSMRLEEQEVSDEITKSQIEDLAHELKQKLDPHIWREE